MHFSHSLCNVFYHCPQGCTQKVTTIHNGTMYNGLQCKKCANQKCNYTCTWVCLAKDTVLFLIHFCCLVQFAHCLLYDSGLPQSEAAWCAMLSAIMQCTHNQSPRGCLMPFAADPSTGSVRSVLPDSRSLGAFRSAKLHWKRLGDIKHFTLSQGDDEVDY